MVVLVILVLSLIATVVSLRAKTWQRFSLKQKINSSSMPTLPEQELSVGDRGTTLSRLSPMGKIEVKGRTYEAEVLGRLCGPPEGDRSRRVREFQRHRKNNQIKTKNYGFSGWIDRSYNFFREPLCDLAHLLFYTRRTLVLGVGVGREDQPAAAYPDALAQGAALDDRLFDDREHESRLEFDPNELEAHYLAGGNVTNVVHAALVSAQKANIMLDFKMATAIDLAGRDVFEAVQMSVNPKVINTPPVAAVAKDGIQLIAKARVTVRANIKQLVGGAGEETVARVGEGIVSSIGSAASHKIVLENPDSISRVVLEKGLDAGTAFEILSIDIADIDVGKNIGAQLQMDQAQADKNIAQAKAEERRAMAVALEQENKAKAQDARAEVICQAEVPLAMAEAFRNGNLGIMDYYKMKNIMADTTMRETIARPEKK